MEMNLELFRWRWGDRVRKISGSDWQGKIVGFYSTRLTPIGYVVESEYHRGSVQLYPEKALEILDEITEFFDED